MPDFHLTKMGHKFYEHGVPELIKTLKELKDEMKRNNDLKEREINERV